MSDLAKLDLYKILEVPPDANDKQIIKAYRKKALKCHPDKNPDNPDAVTLFHELSRALEVLTDAPARAAYDKVLKAKHAAELRNRVLDSKRKKFKEDLEAKERQHADGTATQNFTDKTDAEKLQAEIERLRKEGSRLLEEEQEQLREELKKEEPVDDQEEEDNSAPRLKIKWKAKKSDASNGGYSEELLQSLLSKYGCVKCLLLSSKKKGSAVVEYESSHSAMLAFQNEIGLTTNPLTLTWISGKPTSNTDLQGGSISSQLSPPMTSDERDFESVVLMKMRQAEERRRLIEQMQNEDKDS